MARRRKNKLRLRNGMGTIVILVIVIVMAIFGGMLVMLSLNGASPSDVAGTELEPVAGVTATGLTIFNTLLPIIVWLCVAGVVIVALVFVYRSFRKRRK